MNSTRTEKEEIYDERIAPLMRQVIAICKKSGINSFAEFSLGYDKEADQTLFCTTSLPVDESDGKGWDNIVSIATHAKKLKLSGLMAMTIVGDEGMTETGDVEPDFDEDEEHDEEGAE